ncbi:MAG: HAMP domain-containing histidine kinase [Ignavibacteriaceae bacterium]|nr:HAMP domain-containing histidine kinase [Ignavibacteriaceae bacterium]
MPLGFFVITSVKREIEQREKIERLAIDLEKANEKLQELDQMKSEFLSLATHQIRAPLTAIKGYASMLYDGDFGVLPEKAKHSSEVIIKSTETLITIVNDFLNISRIEQGRMVYDKSTFKLNEVLKEVVLEIEPNISKAKLELNLNIKEGPQYEVTADKAKIKQIIGNIIDNSIKYTQKGFIHINLFEEKDMYKISIKDSGVGIDSSEINKLFTKFSRTKDASKVNVIGTGLGLYIAKKMITAQGGDIEVKSEGLGKGTEFIIDFPKN